MILLLLEWYHHSNNLSHFSINTNNFILIFYGYYNDININEHGDVFIVVIIIYII